jgi:hypothetical protein
MCNLPQMAIWLGNVALMMPATKKSPANMAKWE